ncbi:MAG TPA: ROK family protein [Candidatus Paceibacterota bacterium]|nr:ROK family protein [Candidatus Paceibacterota bacterium]
MYIACDIGGTKFRVAKSHDNVNFDEPVILDTPNNPTDGLRFIADTVLNLTKGQKITSAVFGIAGVLDQEHNFLIKSPHLPAWENIPLKEFFEKEFGAAGGKNSNNASNNSSANNSSNSLGFFSRIFGRTEARSPEIFIENDTDIVGLGEAVAGAGLGFEIVVYITVSTGIGGAKIVSGKFEKNRYGFEPGFQILNNQTGQNWEDISSGTVVEQKYKMHPKDVAKTPAWAEVERNVAIGIHNSILHWSPDVVVVGGSMARDFNFENLKKEISSMMKIHPKIPEIKMAELGSIGGIHGGFAFLRSR